jgi:hypothetical protein
MEFGGAVFRKKLKLNEATRPQSSKTMALYEDEGPV